MKSVKICISILLVLALSLLPSAAIPASDETESAGTERAGEADGGGFSKNEVIYASLSSEGEVDAIYAVNHFEVQKPGWIRDHGAYTVVSNLTSSDSLTEKDGAVEFYTEEKNFYYRGDLISKALPWNFKISYDLDGAAQSPNELAGATGNLEIRIEVSENAAVNPIFYKNYMVQISLTLDTEQCWGIEAPGATIADAGTNKSIHFTMLPGQSGIFRVQADVTDFSMQGIEISAVPFSMQLNLPDSEQLAAPFQSLADAVNALNTGSETLRNGAESLAAGADALKTGSAEIQAGLSRITESSQQLSEGSAEIAQAFSYIASALDGSPLSDAELMQNLTQLPGGLSALEDSLKKIAEGLRNLNNAFQTAYAALDTAIRKIPAAEITPEQIEALYASAGPEQAATIDTLVSSYRAAKIVRQTYLQIQNAFETAASETDPIASSVEMVSKTLGNISEEWRKAFAGMDAEQLTQMVPGLLELCAQYADFHAGLKSYAAGVGTLSGEYDTFHAGVLQMNNGAGKLADGLSGFQEGLGQLASEASGIPDRLQTEIDSLLGQYDASDFKAESFLSGENQQIGSVQFLLRCEGVKKEATNGEPPDEPAKETFWTRLKALFTNK